MGQRILLMKADYNDADYCYSETELDKWVTEEDLERIKRIVGIIKEHGGEYNWCNSDYGEDENKPDVKYKDLLSVDDINFFDEFVPCHENGIHTIEDIRIITVEETLF